MRTTASFDLFPDAPSERAIARARWLAQEGRVADAEAAYRSVLAARPELKEGWAECFELLRRHNRAADALALAEGALGQFGATAFPFTLQAAALVELGRYREALTALERALEGDPDLALAWHELGYAAYRLGDPNRALLALDRAFALEPHTETLRLRGRILRDAGRYQAAEVAFEGAAQATEQQEIRDAAEREILATRRFALYAPRKPDDLGLAQRVFAETGAVVLASVPSPAPPTDPALLRAFTELASDAGWVFGQVIALDAPPAGWGELAASFGTPTAAADADPERCPLVVATRAPLEADISDTVAAVRARGGLVFALEGLIGSAPDSGADVIGALADGRGRRSLAPDLAEALTQAQHPASRLAGRRLRPRTTPPDPA
ncbi:MAG TPA: CDC27 family protein [Gemmatimonadales bacterium]|nr:CDC27 family protein [Gemmatimonadales bacterium]